MPRHVPARIYRRVPFQTAVRLEFDRFHGFVEQYSANLSLGGMFIVSDEPPAPGSELAVEFRLGDGFELIRGRGRVMWVREAGDDGEPAGFGLRFLELTPGSRELIFRLVERRVREGDRVFDLDDGPPARPDAPAGEELAAPPWELPPPRAGEEPGAVAGTAATAATVVVASRFGRAARELPEPPIEPPAPAPPAADPEVSFAGLVDEEAADPASAAWSAVRSLESGGGPAGAPALSLAGEEGTPEAEGFSEREDEAGASLGVGTTGFGRDDARMRWDEADGGPSVSSEPSSGSPEPVGEGGGEDPSPSAWSTAGSEDGPFAEQGASTAAGGLPSIGRSESPFGKRGDEDHEVPALHTVGSGATPFEDGGAAAGGPGGGSTGGSASLLGERNDEVGEAPAWGAAGSGVTPIAADAADAVAGGELSIDGSASPLAERGDEADEAGAGGTAGPVGAGSDEPAGAEPFGDSPATGLGAPAAGAEASADSPWPWAAPLPETGDAASSPAADGFGDEFEQPARSRRGRVAVAAAAAAIAALAVAGYLWLGPGDDSTAAVASPPAAQPAPVAATDGALPPPRSLAADSAAAAAPPRPAPAAVTASVAAPRPVAASRPGTIESIAWQRRAGGLEFEIAGAGPISAAAVGHFTVGGERPRLVVEIGGVERPYARGEIAVGEGPVERVRTGFHPVAGSDAGELRIVFDLAAPAEATVETAGGRVRVRFGGG